MISDKDARKAYGGTDMKVIRKGEKGWTSDRQDRRGEKYMLNPTTKMTQKMQILASAEVDTSSLETITDTAPLKTRMQIPRGNDLVTVELRERADSNRYWHTCYVSRNGAI